MIYNWALKTAFFLWKPGWEEVDGSGNFSKALKAISCNATRIECNEKYIAREKYIPKGENTYLVVMNYIDIETKQLWFVYAHMFLPATFRFRCACCPYEAEINDV
jgi:hypothetical protein